MAYFECRCCGHLHDDGDVKNCLCWDCIEGNNYSCYLCKHRMSDFDCSGCDGENKFEESQVF